MTLEIQVLAWDRHIDVVMLNWLIRSQPSPLDSCISITILYIYKKEKKKDNKPAQIRFHSKRPHTITKMKDNINMDSTIAGSMTARSYLTTS
jgi:hypothetical protein